MATPGAGEPPRPTARPTLKAVAARAGVSFKTVSRVVNGEPGVSDGLAERVRTAADELGYRPDKGASALRRRDRRTATVGVLLQDLSNPFSAAVLRAVEDVAQARSVVVVAGSIEEDERLQRDLVEELVARRVDGLILAPVAADQSLPLAVRQAGPPVVFVDRAPAQDGADAVVVDNVGGARAATEHLLSHGHQRIAFFGDRPSITTATDRLAGYRAALHAAGVEPDPALVWMGPGSERAGYVATMRVLGLPEPPTAVFAAQNFLTMGALRALAFRGDHHRVALVGFDDFPLADVLDPPVTVVAQDVAAVGRRAAQLLFARLDGDASPPHVVRLPTQLVVRGSGEIAPVRSRRRPPRRSSR
jgi:LacI family transcriptional regulator